MQTLYHYGKLLPNPKFHLGSSLLLSVTFFNFFISVFAVIQLLLLSSCFPECMDSQLLLYNLMNQMKVSNIILTPSHPEALPCRVESYNVVRQSKNNNKGNGFDRSGRERVKEERWANRSS